MSHGSKLMSDKKDFGIVFLVMAQRAVVLVIFLLGTCFIW
jgi:hypothetical protein